MRTQKRDAAPGCMCLGRHWSQQQSAWLLGLGVELNSLHSRTGEGSSSSLVVHWPSDRKLPSLFSFFYFQKLFFPFLFLFSLFKRNAPSFFPRLEKDAAFITHSESYWLEKSKKQKGAGKCYKIEKKQSPLGVT